MRLDKRSNLFRINFLYTHVGLICIDEAQYIKNSKSQTTQALKKLKTPLRVALSGTPVENNLAELWSVFDFVLPKYLGTLKDFKSSYSKPIEVSCIAEMYKIQ